MTKKAKIGIAAAALAATLLIVAGAAAAGLLLSGRASEPHPPAQEFTVTAHTGCMDTQQNTLESLKAALESGAQTVEFDVRFLEDGTPVMAHNERDKSTDSPRAADALAMVAACPGITINLDLKEFTPLERLQEEVERAGMLDRVFYTGVDAAHIGAVREATPEIPCYLNVMMHPLKMRSSAYLEGIIRQAVESGAVGINCNYLFNSESLTRLCRTHGLLLSVWTVDHAGAMDNQLDLAPDNITTRRPDLLLERVLARS